MSLEAQIAELTAALKENSALLATSNSARAEALAAINAVDGASAPATRTRRTKEQVAADAALAAEAEKAKQAAVAPVETTAKTPHPVTPAPEPVYPTVDELRAAAVKFAGVSGDEKTRRTAFMKAVIEEIGIAQDANGNRKIVAAEPEDRAKIIGWLEDFAAGKTVNFQADNDTPAVDEDDIG